jgi:bifunctional DNA-binding transcriptional regulator/antitoxin component of YhaV-PrlF toxin-antitoxin module
MAVESERRQKFKAKLRGDEARKDASASFTLPFDAREVWGKAKVPVRVTINGHTWRSTVGNRGGIQYIVVNAEARRAAGVKAGDVVMIEMEPDAEKREIAIPAPLQKALGVRLTQKLNGLSFSHKKEFIVWYSGAKKDETRARRVQKMKQMLSAGKVIS